MTKTWTAELEISSGTLHREQFLAKSSQWDTLRETIKAAEREADEMLRAGLGTEARVHMYKTTKARGTEYDRQAAYLWVENGTVYIQR